MSGRRILFLDRDGTLNEETPDEQIDSLEKIRLMPSVVPALLDLKAAGFAFVMVTNQDGLGDSGISAGTVRARPSIHSRAVCFAGHRIRSGVHLPAFLREDCECRKPKTGMVRDFLAAHSIDKSRSYMIGDRDTDMEFAVNLGVQGSENTPARRASTNAGQALHGSILGQARRAHVHRKTQETDIRVEVDLSRDGPDRGRHRPGLLRSHAGTNRKARRLCARPQMQRRPEHR